MKPIPDLISAAAFADASDEHLSASHNYSRRAEAGEQCAHFVTYHEQRARELWLDELKCLRPEIFS